MINPTIITNNIIEKLETSGCGLFEFDKMQRHTKYSQEDDTGIVRLDDDNDPIVIKQYDNPSLHLILSAISREIVDGYKFSGTLEDLSDVQYINIDESHILVYNGDTWINQPLSGISFSATGIGSHGIPLNYLPKSDGLGKWNRTYIREDNTGKVNIRYGTSVNKFSIDGTLSENSDNNLVTEKAIKTYVDTQITGEDLDFAGDLGTGSIDLNSQVFTISGTTNRITTSAINQILKLTLPQDIHTGASPTFAGLTVINAINEFSIDGTLSGNSDDALVTEKAIKTYVDNEVSAINFWERNAGSGYLYPSNITDRVGIGEDASTPAATLEVRTDHNGATELHVHNATAGSASYSSIRTFSNSGQAGLFNYDQNYTGNTEFQKKSVLYTNSSVESLVLAAETELQIYTGGVASANRNVVITSAGNVGIDNTNPERLLTVGGTKLPVISINKASIVWSANQKNAFGCLDGEAYISTVNSSTTGGVYHSYFSKGSTGGVNTIFQAFSENDYTGSYGSFDYRVYKHNGSGSVTAHGATSKVFLVKNFTNTLFSILGNGNVGIGTATPGALLDVRETSVNTEIQNWYADGKKIAICQTNADGDGAFRIRNNAEVTKIMLNSDDDSYIIGGSVGIGTATPGALLHVNDGVSSGLTAPTTPGIIISDDVAPSLYFEDTGEGATDRVIRIANFNETLQITAMSDDGSTGIDGINLMAINRNGNVGIGTNTPDVKLSIQTTSVSAVQSVLKLQNDSNTAGAGVGMHFLNSNATACAFIYGKTAIVDAEYNLYFKAGQTVTDFIFTKSNDATSVIIKYDGKVGIGTGDPLLNIGTAAGDLTLAHTEGLHIKSDTVSHHQSYLIIEGASDHPNGGGHGMGGLMFADAGAFSDDKIVEMTLNDSGGGEQKLRLRALNDDLTAKNVIMEWDGNNQYTTVSHATNSIILQDVVANAALDDPDYMWKVAIGGNVRYIPLSALL